MENAGIPQAQPPETSLRTESVRHLFAGWRSYPKPDTSTPSSSSPKLYRTPTANILFPLVTNIEYKYKNASKSQIEMLMDYPVFCLNSVDNKTWHEVQ